MAGSIARLLAAMGLFGAACTPAAAQSAFGPTTSHEPLVQLTSAPGVPGNAANGRRLVVATGCGGCHTVYGVPGATGVAGPNLTNVALRPTLAGESIPMSPDNLTRWLLDPPALKPGTTMPRLGLSSEQARDLTAFLYSQSASPAR